MAIELTMPALSPTMEKGTLARWLVKVGDPVRLVTLSPKSKRTRRRWNMKP